jgi:hypothetical protein
MNERYIKTVKSIRLDAEIHELIYFLKQNKINWSKLVHDEIKIILKNKAKELNYKPKVERVLF